MKSPASSKKRGRDKSGSPPPRKKHILSKTYEQSDDDSDIDYSDKSDVDEALNTLIEGDDGNQGSSDEDEEGLALHELSEFFGDEDKTSEPLSADLAKIMEKMFSSKTNSEKIKEISNKYGRPKNINNVGAPKVNKVIGKICHQKTEQVILNCRPLKIL